MNESELKLKGYIRRPDGQWEKPKVGNNPSRPLSEFQKRQEAVPDERQSESLDAGSHRQFKISVHFKMSDQRARDLDGGLATILDCLIACRRQLEDHPEYYFDVRDSVKG